MASFNSLKLRFLWSLRHIIKLFSFDNHHDARTWISYCVTSGLSCRCGRWQLHTFLEKRQPHTDSYSSFRKKKNEMEERFSSWLLIETNLCKIHYLIATSTRAVFWHNTNCIWFELQQEIFYLVIKKKGESFYRRPNFIKYRKSRVIEDLM